MQRLAWGATALAATALLLGACSERADVNPNAPGSPGTGNSAEVVRPAQPDSAPGSPSGIAGSQSHPGSTGAAALPGTTAADTGSASGSTLPTRPGEGLHGGLGQPPVAAASAPDTSAAGNAGSVAPPLGGEGSPNTTSGNAVGRR